MDAAERFRYRARVLDEDDELAIAEAGRVDPGEKLLRSLRWSSAWLPLYSEQLKNRAFREAEEGRALAKGGLGAAWRRSHPSRR